jgi:hypothetical protein
MERLAAPLHIKAYGVHDAEGAAEGASGRRIVANVRPDELQARRSFWKHGLAAFRVPRRNPHGKLVIEKVPNNTPAQESCAAEDHNCSRHRSPLSNRRDLY